MSPVVVGCGGAAPDLTGVRRPASCREEGSEQLALLRHRGKGRRGRSVEHIWHGGVEVDREAQGRMSPPRLCRATTGRRQEPPLEHRRLGLEQLGEGASRAAPTGKFRVQGWVAAGHNPGDRRLKDDEAVVEGWLEREKGTY